MVVEGITEPFEFMICNANLYIFVELYGLHFQVFHFNITSDFYFAKGLTIERHDSPIKFQHFLLMLEYFAIFYSTPCFPV